MGLQSFVEVHPDSHFPIQNLPYGVFRPEPGSEPRPGVAIGDYVLDLSAIASAGLFDGPILRRSDCFHQTNLNKLLGMGRPAWTEARATIQKILSSTEPTLRDNASLRQKALVPMGTTQTSLHPCIIQRIVGSYSVVQIPQFHRIGSIFLLHIMDEHRLLLFLALTSSDQEAKVIQPTILLHIFGPSLKLDFELEMAVIVGPGNELGKSIDVNEAADHIFGLVLMNDWSARDIQAWEYIPLGPFLGKSFGTTISPWIVTLDALEPFACDAPKQNPRPLPYLAEKVSKIYDISLEVRIKPAGEEQAHVVTRSNLKHLYWTLTQQLAHHTINGCNLRPGDLLGTGTISGPEPESYGCLLELTWNGQKLLSLGGTTRKFLEDGDEVIISGFSKVYFPDTLAGPCPRPQWNDMAGKSESPAAQHLGGPVHSAHKEPTQYFMSDPPTLRLLCLEPATLEAIYQVFCQLNYALGATLGIVFFV
ncbi:fumarylacetoacetase [Actinidia rufa]|uniref:Fumarylacetoacetase n=1 Tax=Actinidia rufa TaxID=165716 RepID=A0A7J0EZ16_9ERIC|nr:fumarylacetoacetase [Actinidia rufa]